MPVERRSRMARTTCPIGNRRTRTHTSRRAPVLSRTPVRAPRLPLLRFLTSLSVQAKYPLQGIPKEYRVP
ncbi:hypothetical protein SGPA1_40023 [Streptomyces misionensis JCM 4497]